jgi:large repetitive protein
VGSDGGHLEDRRRCGIMERMGSAIVRHLVLAVWLVAGCSSRNASIRPDGGADTTAQRGQLHTTGNMDTARRSHTATLLPDGKVLVTGGTGHVGGQPSAILGSAELYDRNSGAFTATGSMVEPRHTHTATLLPNGLVLVVGGTGTSSNLASAELYDPADGAFRPTGSMSTARVGHTATLLSDGRVLIAGGWAGGLAELSSAELFDPATGVFSTTGSMTVPRSSHSATLLSAGKVLVTGQYISASAEVYDPSTGTFTATKDMIAARCHHTATSLLSGAVLVSGGVGLAAVTQATAELYDPGTGTFGVTGTMTTARSHATATLLADGKVFVAGGTAATDLGTDLFLASTELYDPATGNFAPAGNMGERRASHAATLLSSGEVLITGGGDDLVEERSSADLYP